MDQPYPAARGRTGLRRLARAAALGFIPFAATLLSTCSDTPTAPNRPGFGFVAVGGTLPALQLPPNLTLDHVRLVVTRKPNLILLDKTYPFDATNSQLTISAQLLLQAQAESLIVKLDYLSGTTLLFSGTETLLVHQGPPGSNPTVQIPTQYVGPGTNVASIAIAPRDTLLTFGADLPFRVTALDGQEQPVTSFYVTWTSSDAQQIVNGAGSLHAAAKRGIITITATTPATLAAPNGVTDHTTITIVPAAATLDLSGGDKQTAPVGSQLPLQLAVLIKGADNLPVPGAVVSFAAKTGGGSVDSLTATSDLNGIARSDATLGPVTGTQTFIARLGALDSVTFSATANGIIAVQTVPLVAGQNHSCALTAGGTTICWGDNSKGQIGNGSNLSQPSPSAVVGGNIFLSLAAGGAHSCGITASGQAFCWGDNSASQLGDGSIAPSLGPKAVSGGLSFSQLAAGTNYTCGLTTTGLAYCWGSNAHGNLGDGGTTPRNVPTAVSGGLSFAAIAIGGDNHTCALTGGGQAYCWGYNLNGQLGDGSTTDRPVPTAVAGGRVFMAISAGSFHTCAITLAGAAFCWGDNSLRQLGDGSIAANQPNPVAVQGGRSFAILSAGANHSCAFTATGQAFCWGLNGAGQIGDDNTTTALQPTAVTGGLTFNALAAGGNHSCGRDPGGVLYCWGENDDAEVGDGTTTNQPAPVAVLAAGGVAATIAVNQGDGLTAVPGGAITPVPCAVITDANGLPVQGVTVTFAVASGNGTVTGTTPVSDASGIVCIGGWTLGALPGANTLTATASGAGISGNPLTFNATGLVVGLRTWTGAVSTVWTTAGNWFPNSVPGLTESVVIPFTGITNFPVLNAAGFGNDLTLASGAALDITGANVLTLNGNVDLSGTLTAATGSLQLSGATKTLRGTLNASSTTISGSYSLNGDLTTTGAVDIAGSSASLDLGANTATIGGTFATTAGGVLIMTNAAANLNLTGAAAFGGGDETGQLTAGVLTAGAGFSQTGPIATSFVASGTHRTVLQNLNGQQTISFANPGSSGFGTLQVLTTFGLHLGSSVTAANDVTVNGAGIGGNLLLDGHTLSVGGDFTVSQNGKISMVVALDSLLVSGNATFTGADENGKLSNGVLRVGGDFSQAGSTTTSFTATGGHKTILGAAVAHTVTFQNPGATGTTSRFQDLDVAGATGNLNLGSNLFVNGQLTSKPSGSAPILIGTGGTRTLTAVSVDVSALVLDNVPLVINGGTIGLFDNVTFQNMPVTGTALTVNNPGQATPFVFGNVVFSTTPTTGFYLVANDNTVGNGQLTLNLVGPTPATPGAFVQLLNGAVVNWPGVIPIRTWLGGVSRDWFNPNNWSPAGVPGAGEDVVVGATGNQPLLTAVGALARNLTGQVGTSLDLAGFDLTLSGDANWLGTMSSTSGAMVLAGGGRTVQGNLAAVTVNGSYSLTGPTVVSGDLLVNSGSITLAGQTLTVGGALQTVGTATVNMTDAADQLGVAGAANFSGGDETGKLTNGVLRVGGDFSVGGSGLAFVASGSHTTIIDGGAAQAISFLFSGSQFQGLDLATTAGGITLTNSITAAGAVSVTTASAVTGSGSLTAPSLSTVAGSNFAPAELSISGPLTVAGTYGVGTTTFTGGTALPVLNYQNLVITVPTSMSLTAATAATGNVDVTSGSLTLSGQALTVGGTLQTEGSGTVTSTNAADQLTVTGDATFAGGDETGKLTNGVLRVAGDFTVGGSGLAFVASGSHTTIINGNVAQSITLPFSGSQFQGLQLGNTAGGVTLSNPIVAAGPVSVTTASSVIGSGSLTAPNLTTVVGSSFAPAALSIGGPLTVAGTYGVVTTTFTGGTTLPVVSYQNLVIQLGGTITLSGPTTVSGNLTLNQGNLALGGQSLTVNGPFGLASTGTATLSMTDAADLVAVLGPVSFGGGDETGKLTAGTLRVAGDFTTSNAGTAFVASDTHTTVLDGTAAQAINFSLSGNQLHDLQITNVAAPVTLSSTVNVAGQLTVGNSAIHLSGGGNTLSVGGLAVTGLTLDNVLLTLNADTAALETFANVTFQNYAPTATQLTVNHPGLPGSALSFTNLTFSTQPTTGFYLRANDSNGSTGGVLTLNVVTSGTPNAALGQSLTQVANGALVSWGQSGGAPSWTGFTSTDWSTTSNWSSGAAPTATDDVTIPAGALNQPTLTAAVNPVNALSIASGATLTMSGTQQLQVNGDFSQLGTIAVASGTPGVFLLGTGRTAGGTSGARLVVEGTYSLNSALTLSGTADLAVQLSGQLALNGQRLTVGGALSTNGSGHLVMTNPLDTLVASSASFNSTSPGTLSAGGIKLTTQLSQTGASSIGFAATGSNTVIFTGAGPATIAFANSNPATGPNFLQHLTSDKTGGEITIAGPLRITGDLNAATGAGGLTGASHTFVGGAINLASGNPISLDTLVVGGTLAVATPADYQVPLVRFVGLAGQVVPTNLFYQNMDFLAAVGLGGGFGMSGKLTVGANVALAGSVTTGELVIDAGGLLDLNGNSVTDNGDLITQAGGQLKMANPSDDIIVNGNAVFGGGDETGLLTSGTIHLSGNFTQASGGSPASFVASGSHAVDLQGPAIKIVAFTTPASSRFQILEVSGSGGVNLATQVNASAAFLVFSTATVGGIGPLITPSLHSPVSSVISVNSVSTIGDNLQVAGSYTVINTQLNGTTVPSLTYQNLQITSTGTMTLESQTGVPGNLLIDLGTLDVGGNKLFVGGSLQTDAGGALKMGLATDSVVVSGPAVFAGTTTLGRLTAGVLNLKQDFTQTAGFSPYSFAASSSHITEFSGGSGQSINFVGGAPSGFNSLVISNVAAAVSLASAVNAFGNVVIQSGGNLTGGTLTTPALTSNGSGQVAVNTLNMTTNQLNVSGPYDVAFTVFGSPTFPDSTSLLPAPYQNLQISLPEDHVMLLGGNVTVANDLLVDGGNLVIGGSQLIVNGNFTTGGTGIFEMKSEGASMEVDGNTLFGGGSTAGHLFDGILELRGDITQSSLNSAQSFAADGSHLTRVTPGTKTFFESPGTSASHFGNVVYSGSGAWNIASSVVATGIFEGFDGDGTVGTSASGSTLTIGGLFSGNLTFDAVPLIIEDPFGFYSGSSGNSFINFGPGETQLTILSPSPGFTISLDNITFTPLTAGDAGLYISAKDTDGFEPSALNVVVTNSNESPGAGGNGPAFTATDGIASVDWQ